MPWTSSGRTKDRIACLGRGCRVHRRRAPPPRSAFPQPDTRTSCRERWSHARPGGGSAWVGTADRRPHQANRIGVRHVPVKLRHGAPRRNIAIVIGQRTGEVELERLLELRPASQEPVDRLDEVDVRARQDVQPLHASAQGSAQLASPPMLQPEGGMQISGMDDAELPIASRRRLGSEIAGIETVRNCKHRSSGQLGKAAQQTIDGFGRAHDDRGGRAEERAHPPEYEPPMEPRRVDHHFVERPGVP